MQYCSLLLGASTGTIGFQNPATLFLALKICNFNGIYFFSDLVCDDHHFGKFPSGFVYILLCLQKKIRKTHKKKLNSVCTGLVFILALLAVPAPMGFPSTLSCHVAVKPTICEMLLTMKNLELIHCYQHLANPANVRWARHCTQA